MSAFLVPRVAEIILPDIYFYIHTVLLILWYMKQFVYSHVKKSESYSGAANQMD